MAGLVVPDEVTVALAEIVESAKEGLLALAVGAGLQVMQTLVWGWSRSAPRPPRPRRASRSRRSPAGLSP